MLIDIVFAALLVLAAIKGYQRGLILGVFSFVAIIVGLAAALKLSTVVAGYIGSAVNISDEWLPLVSFAAVFVVVVIIIRLGAKALEETAETVMLGWANKVGGVLFYAAIYLIIFSILLFYMQHMKLLQPATIAQSATYSFVQPFGPKVINGIGSVIPFFKDMFADLENFFSRVATNIPSK
ncbi:MAG TPA: CvpA family protein [Chitinophagaceae bacterium]|jgi:membrane protein required for colicin V production|nr:CvpA family protein [Chitinophagaceae bacterium]HMU56873.1 CvpA family protein [Chitinophagaceae bacterium]